MKKYVLFIVIISSMFFIGCFNYVDINDALFVTAIVYDEDEDSNITMYTEVFKAKRSAAKVPDKGERIVFKSRGKTVFEAIRDLTLTSSKKFNYTQNKVIIFTDRAAKKGIKKYVDMKRDQEFLVRPYVCVYTGDANKLMQGKYKEEEYIGLFIYSLVNNQGVSSRAVNFPINDFLNDRLNEERTNVVTILTLDLDQGRDSIKMQGGAIMKNDKMVGVIDKAEAQGFNFIINKIGSGSLEVTNPQSKKDYVSLEILKSKTKTKVYYDGKNIKFKKIVNIKAAIAESQSALIINKENINKLEQNCERNIVEYCNKVFKKYNAENLDVFNLQDEFKNKYPSEEVQDVIKISEMEIEPHVTIEGSGKDSDFS